MYNNAYRGFEEAQYTEETSFCDDVVVPADLTSLLVRLDRLNSMDLRGAATGLLLTLEPLARAAPEAQTHYQMLRAIKAAVLGVSAVLPKPRLSTRPPAGGSGQGSAPSLTPGLTVEQRLYQAMANNCVQLLHSLDRGQGGYSDRQARRREWAIRNGFRFLGRQVLYALHTGRDWPAGTWQSLHELFVYLVMRGHVRLHGAAQALAEEDFNAEWAYKRLLMMGLLSETVAPGRVDAASIDGLRVLAKDARLVESDGLVGEYKLILVEVGRDRPPRLRLGCLDDPFRGWVLRVPDQFDSLVLALDPFRSFRQSAAA